MCSFGARRIRRAQTRRRKDFSKFGARLDLISTSKFGTNMHIQCGNLNCCVFIYTYFSRNQIQLHPSTLTRGIFIFTYLKVLSDVLLQLSISLVKLFVLNCLVLDCTLLKGISPAIKLIRCHCHHQFFSFKENCTWKNLKKAFNLVTDKQDIFATVSQSFKTL